MVNLKYTIYLQNETARWQEKFNKQLHITMSQEILNLLYGLFPKCQVKQVTIPCQLCIETFAADLELDHFLYFLVFWRNGPWTPR
jgi:hypothetical protein